MGAIQAGGPDLLPLRTILRNVVRELTGEDVDQCAAIPTWVPNWRTCQIGYTHVGDIRMFHGGQGMDWRRGWIDIGAHPTMSTVMASILETYLKASGRRGDLAFWHTVANRMRGWSGEIMGSPDAVIFDNDGLDFAVRQTNGDYFSTDGLLVTPEFGIPLRLYR